MLKLLEPIKDISTRRTNATLHGRSIYRPEDVPGHNVFAGWQTWADNGHHAVGDAVDLFAAGMTPVYAIADGTQTVWRNDTQKTEVIYLEGAGWMAVYAHINATHEGTGMGIPAGGIVGYVRTDLADPHLHFELWLDGKVVSAPTSKGLRNEVAALCKPPHVGWQAGDPLRVVLKSADAERTLTEKADFRDGQVVFPAREVMQELGYIVDASKLKADGVVYVTKGGTV